MALMEEELTAIKQELSVCYKLSGGTRIFQNYDLDVIVDIGNYYCTTNSEAGTLKHCPISAAFTMKVYHGVGTSYLTQYIKSYYNGIEYMRFMPNNDIWGDWFPVTITFVNLEIASITLDGSGYYLIPKNLIPGTRNYIFAEIAWWGTVSTKTSFNICGRNRDFYINGTANSVITNVTIRFFYYGSP